MSQVESTKFHAGKQMNLHGNCIWTSHVIDHVYILYKAVSIQKICFQSDPNIRGYILPVFKAILILHSVADTPSIQYHEAAS